MRFRKYIAGLTLTASVLMTAAGSAQEEKKEISSIEIDPASKARIEFIQGEWSFGGIEPNQIYYHNFPFRNVGTDTLVIVNVKPTCGCTIAPLSADRVAPGDTAEISISFNTAKMHGKVRKFVNVDSNDPVNPYYRIVFDGVVGDTTQPIVSDPAVADFGDFQGRKKPKLSLQITSRDTEPVNLIVVDKPPDDILKAALKKTKLDSGKSTTLQLQIESELETGPFASTITLEAEGKPETRLSIPIKGKVVE